MEAITIKTRYILPAVLVAAAIASPASANWFSNPQWGINRFVGSAPNPTPRDIREMRQPTVTEDADAEAATQTANNQAQKPQPQQANGAKAQVAAAPRR